MGQALGGTTVTQWFSSQWFSWQVDLLQMVQSIHSPFFDFVAIAASFVGNYHFYIWLIALCLWLFGDEIGTSVAILAMVTMVFTDLGKALSAVQRPIGISQVRSQYIRSAAGSSFPSGHALVSMAVYGYLSDLYGHLSGLSGKKIAWIARWLWLLPITIGLSRLYLGVHWPTDVVAGWTFGWLLAKLFDGPRMNRIAHRVSVERDVWMAIVLLVISLIPLVPDTVEVIRFVAIMKIATAIVGPVLFSRSVGILLSRVTVGLIGIAVVEYIHQVGVLPITNQVLPTILAVWVVVVGRIFSTHHKIIRERDI